MTLPIAHILNGELGFDVRTKLNDLIDLAGGGAAPFTPGSVLFADASGFTSQDNANFFWDNATDLLTSGQGVKIKGATSGVVTLNTKAIAGTWTLTLPDTAGTSGYVLSTNGSGVTSWIAGGGGGGMAIGGAITGGTASRVLFTGAGGVLDDDSTFIWNDTLKDLAIGGAYYVNAARALYVVPNVTENNWFEGNAGNQTVSGYGNFGTGDLALSSITSGYDNVAVGTGAMKSMTSGFLNFALGSSALLNSVLDKNNTAIGTNCLYDLGIGSAGSGNNSSNVAIGYNALAGMRQGSGNIAIGYIALGNIGSSTTAVGNTVIGEGAGGGLGFGGAASVNYNTIIGSNAANLLNGASGSNTWIGGYRGTSGTMSNSICLSEGGGAYALFDWHVTTSFIWTMSYSAALGIPPGLHIYNYQNALGSTTNYERAILDWNPMANVFSVKTQAGGTGTLRLLAIGAFPKAGAPAASDLPSGCFAMIDDTSGGATWLVFNKSGTIRKVQLT